MPKDTMVITETPTGATRARDDEPASALWATYIQALNPDYCGSIVDKACPLVSRRAAHRADHLYVPDLKVATTFFGRDAMAQVIDMMRHANKRWWNLDLGSFQFKVLRYQAGHHAPAHTDLYPGSMRRKLTAIVHLTAPDLYEGGILELMDNASTWWPVPLGLGDAAVFPSWTHHRVTPISNGERWTLAAWGYGPPIR